MRCRGALCALAIVAALGGADASQAARDQKWLGKLSTKARNLRSALETAPRRDLSEHEAVRASLATTRRDRIAALLHLPMFFPPPQALSEEEVELLKEARATALLPVSALSLSAAVGRRAPVWAWLGRESRPPPPAPPFAAGGGGGDHHAKVGDRHRDRCARRNLHPRIPGRVDPRELGSPPHAPSPPPPLTRVYVATPSPPLASLPLPSLLLCLPSSPPPHLLPPSSLLPPQLHWLPEAAIGVLVGMFASGLAKMAHSDGLLEKEKFDFEFFMIWLLPPIIFEAGFNMNVQACVGSGSPRLTSAHLGSSPRLTSALHERARRSSQTSARPPSSPSSAPSPPPLLSEGSCA